MPFRSRGSAGHVALPDFVRWAGGGRREGRSRRGAEAGSASSGLRLRVGDGGQHGADVPHCGLLGGALDSGGGRVDESLGGSGSALRSGLSRIRAKPSGRRAACWARTLPIRWVPSRASTTRAARSASSAVSNSRRSFTRSRKLRVARSSAATPWCCRFHRGCGGRGGGDRMAVLRTGSGLVSRRSLCGRSRHRWRPCGAWRAPRSGCAG